MAQVLISATRVRSVATNRRIADDALRDVVGTRMGREGRVVERDAMLEFADLEALAKLFGVTWAYLLHDEEETRPDLGHDNRTLANQQAPFSTEMLAEFQAALRMLETAAELFDESHYEVPDVADGVTDPEVVGARVRDFLGVSLEQQRSARDEYASLRLWVEALHRRGIYVSQRRLRDRTTRAFSAIRDGQALIVVDTGDTAYARVFSLLHEYCHIVDRTAGLCDLDEHSSTERYCNAVAAAALMPASAVRGAVNASTIVGLDDAGEADALRALSSDFGVSQAAFLIRLRELSILMPDEFEAMERRRRNRRAVEKKPGGTFYPTQINRVGRRYARRVVSAVDNKDLDRTEASSLLEIGDHLFDRYRGELEKADTDR